MPDRIFHALRVHCDVSELVRTLLLALQPLLGRSVRGPAAALGRRQARVPADRVRASKLFRRDDTHDIPVRVENPHGRDGLSPEGRRNTRATRRMNAPRRHSERHATRVATVRIGDTAVRASGREPFILAPVVGGHR